MSTTVAASHIDKCWHFISSPALRTDDGWYQRPVVNN
jgi:hypothetical protein